MIQKSDEDMRKGFYAGSFDPFTVGHKSIVDRALAIFDTVTVGIGYNESKPGALYTPQERAESILRIYAGEPRVEVMTYKGLTVDAARQVGATSLVRGVRSAADFESERTMADVNRQISGLETVLLVAIPEYESVSSSMVRELIHNGYDVSRYLPDYKKKE